MFRWQLACWMFILSVPPAVAGGESPRHVVIYRQSGRFAGWPANHGIWSWGDEILVGFGLGYHKDNGPLRHAIDHDRPERHLLARSRDGGQAWTIEQPQPAGALAPAGKALHGIAPPEVPQPQPRPCPGGIDFGHPDFALTLRMTDVDVGPSYFYYSYDRGQNWQGPFVLPDLDTPGIAARTDYVVEGPGSCLVFLTAAKADGEEGRPLCARTVDGGLSWQRVAWIGPEPPGMAIMPSTVRLDETSLVTTLRVHHQRRRWIDAWQSDDAGRTWQYLARPVDDTGEGNPPALVRLADGRLCLAYGVRAEPYRIAARLSSDGGRSWTDELVLRGDGGGRDVGYPRAVVRPDGKVVVVYYFHDQPLSERYLAATIWQPPPP